MFKILRKTSIFGMLCLLSLTSEAQKRVTFNINTALERKAISPLIYGTNDNYEHATAKRLGGNRITNYNWENNASNAGFDWYHNSDDYVPWQRGVPENEYNVPGAALKYFHNTSLQQNAYSLITLPMAKYVTADKNGAVGLDQIAPSSRWKTIKHHKSTPYSLTPDLTDDDIYTDEEVNFLIQNYGTSTSARGVKAYALDNEPGLWFHSHSRMWGSEHLPVNFLMNSSYELAGAVKSLDPNAEIFGPASWGVSEFEDLQGAPDWASLNNGKYRNFISYYLANMKAKQDSDANHRRLLDVLTLHWYPQGRRDGLSPFDNGTDYFTNKARMEMTRSLWDPTYIENTWIGEDANKVDQFLPFLPKMQSTIATHYPGTKFAITEYSYMGIGHASGGIAQADALGIFGKQGLYFASYWGAVIDYIKAGFDVYRNYDGNGGKFGDISVRSVTNDIEVSSVHASIESADESRTHVVAMNKSQDEAITATFEINSDKVYKGARVWAFDSNGSAIRQLKNVRVINNNKFEYVIPPLTVCHLVLTEEDLSLFPDFEIVTVDPSAGYSDGTANFQVKAQVSDGDHNISSVTADLSELGGSATAPLQLGSDGFYQLNFHVANGTPSGLKTIVLTAIDATNRTASSTLKYRVIKKTTSALIWDGDVIKKGKGEKFYDANDVKAAGAKIELKATDGNTGPGSLFMHFIHSENTYNVLTWRLSDNDNPVDSRDISDYGFLEFKIRSNAPAGSDIEFSIRDSSPQLHTSGSIFLKQGGYVSAFSSTAYTTVKIPMSALTAGSDIKLDQIWQFNFSVNTATNGFDVWIDDIRVLPYSHPYKEPKITDLKLSSPSGYADGLTEVTLSGKVDDPDANLKEVTVNLSELNGSNRQLMSLVGDRYTHTFKVPTSVAYGDKQLTVTAKDSTENAVDVKLNYKVNQIASSLLLWDGDQKNTGAAVTVNTQTTVTIDSLGGNFGPVSLKFHMDKATDGFAGAMWDWNIGTANAQLQDLSDKRYLNFYVKVNPPSPNFDMEIYLKDRNVASTPSFRLKDYGWVTTYTGNYQLVRVPLSTLFASHEIDEKQVARFGLLTNQIEANLDFKIDDIFATGSAVADVKLKITGPQCGPNGAITVESIANQTGPFKYYINGLANPAGLENANFANLAAGTYVLRITGKDGFVYMEEVKLNGSGGTYAVKGVVTGNNVVVTVSGGSGSYTYLWSNGATTANLTNVPAGTYSLVVTDVVTKCKATLTVVTSSTSSNPVMKVTPANCAPNGVILVTEWNSSLSNLKFYLNNVINPAGATNPEFKDLKPGAYTVKVTADGFSYQTKVTVEGSGSAPVVTGTSKNGNIDITVKGGSGVYIYEWSEGSTTQDLMELADGNYTVMVTDAASNCKTSFTIAVLIPNFTAETTAAQCAANGIIKLSEVKGGNGNYTYYLNNVINPAGANSPVFANLKPGIYTLKVQDNAGFTLSKKVTVEGYGSAPTITGVVKGRNITTSIKGGSGAYIYEWSEGSTTQHLMEVPDGNYTLTVTDALSGCKASYTATVFTPSAEVTVVNAACAANGSITVVNSNATGIVSYYINNLPNPSGINKPVFQNLKQGTYTIKIMAANAFVWTKVVTVAGTANPPKVMATVTNANVNLQVTGGSGAYIYTWSNGATTRDLREVLPGNYTVKVKDAATGCETSETVTVLAKVEPIMIYPNPIRSEGAINVKFDFTKAAKRTVALKDLTGKVYWKTTISEAKGEFRIQSMALRLGIYLLQIDGADAVIKRILVE